MILSPTSAADAFTPGTGLLLLALAGYVAAAVLRQGPRAPTLALLFGWLAHLGLLVWDIGALAVPGPGARLGFAPVLSVTVWLVIAGHTLETRWLPLPHVRFGLAVAGAFSALLAYAFPGEMLSFSSRLAPLHFVLGIGSYALFGAAVLHALLLDSAERRLRQRGRGAVLAPAAGPAAGGVPLLLLERLTFRFVGAGFVVLSLTLLLGATVHGGWRWDHKSVFSLLSWIVFAALLLGRWRYGWRGLRATRWLYGGALLLLLGYAGSRFVFEVILGRAPT